MNRSQDREAAQRWAQGLLTRSDWVVLDTETTGLDGAAEVIQIGVVGPDGAVLLDTLVKPRRPIPAATTRIHGITDAMVADAPTYPQIHALLEATLGGKLVVAYNAAFDERMLWQTAVGSRMPGLRARWECAMEQYARFVGQMGPRGTYKWQALPRGLRPQDEKHQAVHDCLATLDVIRSMAGVAAPRSGALQM